MAVAGSWQKTPGAARSEVELNLYCGRALIDSAGPAAKERVRSLLRNGLDWPQAVDFARQHRLSPVVYEIVVGAAQDVLSPSELAELRRVTAPSMTAGMVLLRELLRLYPQFGAAQIPVIPYKGPLLAWVAYGNFLRREYLDLDFVVQQRHIPEVVSVLQSAGYDAQFDLREARVGRDGFAPGQYSFLSRPQKILVEFHTERTMRYFPVPLDLAELSSRLMTVEIGDERLHTFSVEDTLVMLCVHGAKHFWERLGWVLDVAKLATAQDIDWARAVQIAAKMQSMRVFLLGLYLAHDLFDAGLPDHVLEAIRRDRAVSSLASKVYAQYAGVSDPSAGVLPRAAFRFRSRDGIGQGLRHMLRLAMSPTESDRETVRLPRWLAPLYVLVRPVRLLREYGAGLKRR